MSLKQSLAISTILVSIVAMAACQASFHASAGGSSTPTSPSGVAGAPATAVASAPATAATEGGSSAVAASPAPTPATVTLAGGKILVQGALAFDSGKPVLLQSNENATILNDLKLFLDNNAPVTQMRIEGHTDNVGDAAANLQLSGQRAAAVKKALVDRGVPVERLLAVGFGDKKPVGDNATDAGRAQNQRIEFRVATFNGKNYLNQDPLGGGTKFD